MSLSFVSKSIQTTTEDGVFEEKPIVSSSSTADQDDPSSLRVDRRPLFDQLRQNKERQEAEEEEFQRNIMRGTLALDEEDVAHLDALDRQKAREESIRAQQTAQELTAFRAARADLMESTSIEKDEQAVEALVYNTTVRSSALQGSGTAAAVTAKPVTRLALPTILKRKRRVEDSARKRKTEENAKTDDTTMQKKTETDEYGVEKEDHAADNDKKGPKKLETPTGIGGLLAGYDSSSEEE